MKKSIKIIIVVIVIIAAIIVYREISLRGKFIRKDYAHEIIFSKTKDEILLTVQKTVDANSIVQYRTDKNFNIIETVNKENRVFYDYNCKSNKDSDYICQEMTSGTGSSKCFQNLDGSMCVYIKGVVLFPEQPSYYNLYLKTASGDKLIYRGGDYPKVYWSRDNHVYIDTPSTAGDGYQELRKIY